MQTTTTIMLDVARLSLQNAAALGHILGCYGAYFVAVRPGTLTVVIPDQLVENLLMTVQRDVLPVQVLCA
ncbi:MAG: hypothetical protein ACRDHZ_00720 [Ktedonobacteraceae bacterium]